MSTRHYDASVIMKRATELGVVLFVESGKVKVRVPRHLEAPPILQVVKDHKDELLAYLMDCCRCGTHVGNDTAIGGYGETGQYVCSRCVAKQQQQPPTMIAGQAVQYFLHDYAAQLQPDTRVALDCETTGLDRYQHKIVTVQIGIPGEVYILDVRSFYGLSASEQQSWRSAFQRLFEAPVIWVGHNLKFDWLFLAHHMSVKPGRTYDTMIAEKALHEGRGVEYSMKATAARYGFSVSKEQQLSTVDLDKTDAWQEPFSPEQLTYMAQDVEIPQQFYAAQRPLLLEQDLVRVVDLENAALLAVIAMESQGALIDREQIARIAALKREKQQVLEADLLPVLGEAYQRAVKKHGSREQNQLAIWQESPVCESVFNLGSSQQLQSALLELGVMVNGTSAEELEAVASQHEIIPALLEWKKLQTALNTFCSKLPGHIASDGRIHADFHTVASGRYVTSHPNLQAIPKQRDTDAKAEDPRRCIVAASGHKLLAADLPNIELRILAEVANDATMLRLFSEGKDLHAETAKLMFHLPADTNTKKHLVHGKNARAIAKTINFGLAYGMGAQGLANRTGVDVETARALMKQYFATYRGVDTYLKRSGREALKRGYAVSLSGRRRNFPKGCEMHNSVLYGRLERSAKNHPIQGTNADILKRALTLLHAQLPEAVHLVLTVHDEIILEAPDTLVSQAERILKQCMLQACKDFLKVVAIPEPDVLVGDYWKKD